MENTNRPLIECVPNFSEGRNLKSIKAITDEISKVSGVQLLHVDSGKSANRTVITFVGEPKAVLEAAFNAIKKASELIDMRKQEGEHPRLGATDVCPLIPISNISLEEVVQLARQLGKQVGRELNIPVYLYEAAATKKERQNLASIRKGEYEGLSKKMKQVKWQPDFGPLKFNAKSGATVIGARNYLIAWNINLNTRDVHLAKAIAEALRERGTLKRKIDGSIERGDNGKPIRIAGQFKAVKAIGWFIEEYDCSQVSFNLINYKISPPHLVYEAAQKVAIEKGVSVTGSELIGMLPIEVMLEAGGYAMKFYESAKKMELSEEELIKMAVRFLGLNDLKPFDPKERIIEYRMKGDV